MSRKNRKHRQITETVKVDVLISSDSTDSTDSCNWIAKEIAAGGKFDWIP